MAVTRRTFLALFGVGSTRAPGRSQLLLWPGFDARPIQYGPNGATQINASAFDTTANTPLFDNGSRLVSTFPWSGVNVRDFGAKGDGTTDDAAAFNAAIAAQPPHGGCVFVPAGTYRVNSPIEIVDDNAHGNHVGVQIVGTSGMAAGASKSTIIEWGGGAGTSMLNIHSRECVIENMTLRVRAKNSLTTIVDIDRATGAGAGACTANMMRRVFVAQDVGTAQFGVRIANTPGVTNCENNVFQYCNFDGFSGPHNACVFIVSGTGQSKNNLFEFCGFGSATYGIRSDNGSFLSRGCNFGSLSTAILLTSANDPIYIERPEEERCARFLDARGTSGGGGSAAAWPVTVVGGRLDTGGIHTDGLFIVYTNAGPLTLMGNDFGSGAVVPNFRIRCASRSNEGARLVSIGNHFPNNTPYETTGDGQIRTSIGCIGTSDGPLFPAIPDEFSSVVPGSSPSTTARARAVTVDRLRAMGGTALVAGDFALSSKWGSAASVASISGTDSRCTFTVASAGTGQATGATVALTFKDGAWATAPFAMVVRNGGHQAVQPAWTTTATRLVITFPDVPVAGQTYTFSTLVMG